MCIRDSHTESAERGVRKSNKQVPRIYLALSRPLKNCSKKPDPALLRNLMDEFDVASTQSPSSDKGVEVPANPPPPQESSAIQAASSAGGKPLVAEPQDALEPKGAGDKTNKPTATPLVAESRAGAHPPERHTMQQSSGSITSGGKTLLGGARVTRDFAGNTKSSTTTFASIQPDPLTDADIVAFMRFIDPKPGPINEPSCVNVPRPSSTRLRTLTCLGPH